MVGFETFLIIVLICLVIYLIYKVKQPSGEIDTKSYGELVGKVTELKTLLDEREKKHDKLEEQRDKFMKEHNELLSGELNNFNRLLSGTKKGGIVGESMLKEILHPFIKSGKIVCGVCNGFQVLVKAGILPGFNNNYKEQLTTLTFNDSGHLQCEWIVLKAEAKNKCIFTKGIETLHVPIAHGEGKFDPGTKEILKKLYENNQVVFKYVQNPNGSIDSIAAISDPSGRVLGIMPHPERNLYSLNDPRSLRMKLPDEGEGLKVFKNAFEYAIEKLV